MEVYSLDIGGSSIKHGIITVNASASEITARLPPITLVTRSFEEVRKGLVSSIAAHTERAGRSATVAISTSGAVNRSGLVLNSGHFESYVNVDWSQILKSELPGRIEYVLTVNDGKASTWAEYQRVGLGSEVFVHFVAGTGIGGGIICFNRLLYGDDETAGALGHMKVGGAGGVVCSCGNQGCVETLASGPAIARSFGGMLEKDGDRRTERLTFDDAFLAARAGDPRAVRAFELAGGWLGAAISNVINVLNPRHITIGGGVMEASAELEPIDGGPYLRSAIRRASELAFEDIAAATVITPVTLGNDGGLVGAASLCASAAKRGG
jgi:glucokinase